MTFTLIITLINHMWLFVNKINKILEYKDGLYDYVLYADANTSKFLRF